jgi:hypothetical protein
VADKLISEAEAPNAKASVGIQAKQWRYAGTFANGAAAVAYLNTPPVQVAGEAGFSVRDNGNVDVFAFL